MLLYACDAYLDIFMIAIILILSPAEHLKRLHKLPVTFTIERSC